MKAALPPEHSQEVDDVDAWARSGTEGIETPDRCCNWAQRCRIPAFVNLGQP